MSRAVSGVSSFAVPNVDDIDRPHLVMSQTGVVKWGDMEMRLSPSMMEYVADQIRAWVDEARK